jgi:purine-nucleoside phosphorylase
MSTDPFRLAERAAGELLGRCGGIAPEVAVVLGSGWGAATDELGDPIVEVDAVELPGFAPSTVPGHGGIVRVAAAGAHRVLVLQGRVHLYEGLPPAAVVHGVRTAVLAGCHVVLLTNAAGSLDVQFGAGAAVLIRDHLNLTGCSPLSGPPPPEPHPGRFVDMTDAYAPRLRELARSLDPTLGEAVYAQFAGPSYETPAEVQMARVLGAGLVGMSTALETIAARHLGAEVMGLSLVTNLAAGLQGRPLRHDEVVAEGAGAGERMGRLLRAVIDRLGADEAGQYATQRAR